MGWAEQHKTIIMDQMDFGLNPKAHFLNTERAKRYDVLVLLLVLLFLSTASSSFFDDAQRKQGNRSNKEAPPELEMAAMAALQTSFTSLSLTSNSFLGHRLFPSSPTLQIKRTNQRSCLIVMRLKHWERKECKPNSLPMLHKMHVKVGDTVKVISGKEKGKIGEITKILKHNSTVIVKDVNLKTKHVKPQQKDEEGEIIKIEGPIHSSNVMLYSKEKDVSSRVGHKIIEDGSKVRYLIKTGEIIDSPEKWVEVIKNKKEAETAVATTS